jgi:hypothetical protein
LENAFVIDTFALNNRDGTEPSYRVAVGEKIGEHGRECTHDRVNPNSKLLAY